MSLIFKTIQTEGIAELSYLLGDDDEGVGAIFDPRADVEIYVEMAREAGLAVKHIFETHIHADLVSGSRELCARLESAKIYSSGEGGAEYGFGPEKVKTAIVSRLAKCSSPRGIRLGIHRSTFLICWPKQTIRTSRGQSSLAIRFSFHPLVALTC